MNSILSVMEKLLHWAAIIESSDDAIISKSMDGYITSWNKGAENLYGYTADEIVGKSVSVLMPSEREDEFPKIMAMLQSGQKIEHYETQRKTKAGDIIYVSITVSPIKDSGGSIIGASKIARDITDRVENERQKDAFISTVSHELKTPITSQKAYGQLLAELVDKNSDDKYRHYVKKINQQTDKLTKLVNDLLELSRMQTGRFIMNDTQFDIDTLLDDTVNEMQLTTKHRLVCQGKSGQKGFTTGYLSVSSGSRARMNKPTPAWVSA